MAIKFSDFGRARLTASIAAATSAPFTMSVDVGSRFSAYGAGDFEYLVLKDASGNREAIKVTARTGNSFTVSSRALMGTTARDWAIGDLVEACLLSETMNEFLLRDGSKSMTGNLDFSGTGRRIIGDLSNETFSNRLCVQTSTANSASGLFVVPSGTGTSSAFAVANSSDPDNASIGVFSINTASVNINSIASGTGSLKPVHLQYNSVNMGRALSTGLDTPSGFSAGTYNATTNPAVKTKKLTGTTAVSPGYAVSLPHGLTASKILAVNAFVQNVDPLHFTAPGNGAGPTDSRYYTLRIYDGDIIITNGDSATNIVSRPITLWITYEV